MTSYAGHYPIETRSGEIERLHIQGAAMAPDTQQLLDLIGVAEGWSCLDIGCGPGGITKLLSDKVGPSGRVVGLDKNEVFLDHARASAADNTEFHLGDAYASDLAPESFDFVHMRFIASTAGDPEELIREAVRLARSGGAVVMQEPDGSSLNCYPPHPAWDKLKSALLGAFSGVGADLHHLSRSLYLLLRKAGLAEVKLRTFIVAVRSEDPMVDYLPSTVESLQGTVLDLGLLTKEELTAALAECREHLKKPDTSFTMYTVYQVWGWKA